MSWSIEEGRLKWNGTEVLVADVLAALAESDGQQIRRDLPKIRFSRVAIRRRIQVAGAFPDGLSLRVGVEKGGRFFDLPLSEKHVVVAGTWHAVDPDTDSRVLDTLEECRVGVGEITAGALIDLTCSLEADDLLVDEVTEAEPGAPGVVVDAMTEPAGLLAELYPYQRYGSRFLRVLCRQDLGGLLADEMGLGKTLQAIAVLLDNVAAGPSLIVSPAALTANWRRELERFAPSLSRLEHVGARRAGVASGIGGHDVVLTTYDTVVNDLSFLEDIEWGLVVIDEAQLVRNPLTRRSAAVKSLRRRSSIAITGTPVENSLRDLWSISEFLLPQLLGRLDDFESRFPDEHQAAERLGKIVRPITLRRRIQEVGPQLPERIEIPLATALRADERSSYDRIVKESPGIAGVTRRRVFCAHGDDGIAAAGRLEVARKTDLLRNLASELVARSEKAIIFASFSQTLDALARILASDFPSAAWFVLDGRTNSETRQLRIDEFQADPRPGWILANPRALGVGLNITSANHVVHFNPEYNPAVTDQATARAFRIGQSRSVFVYHYFYEGTVEEDALDISAVKRQLAEGVDGGVREIIEGGLDG